MSIQNGFDSHLKHAEGDFGRGGDFQLGFRQFLVGGAHFELVFHEPDTRTHARTRLSRGENQHQNHRPTCKHTIKIATKKKCCQRRVVRLSQSFSEEVFLYVVFSSAFLVSTCRRVAGAFLVLEHSNSSTSG